MRNIAVYGGTFDPIHNGHILTSRKIQSDFHFDNYNFIPCKSHVLKPHNPAYCEDRINMLHLALDEYPEFTIDLREVHRDTPSYMIDTLVSIRDENSNASITLILGYDAFLTLPHWYKWTQLIKVCNLLVINRNAYKGKPIPEPLVDFIKKYERKSKKTLLNNTNGILLFYDAGHYDISSSKLREEIKKDTVTAKSLPKAVIQYIKEKKLYQ